MSATHSCLLVSSGMILFFPPIDVSSGLGLCLLLGPICGIISISSEHAVSLVPSICDSLGSSSWRFLFYRPESILNLSLVLRPFTWAMYGWASLFGLVSFFGRWEIYNMWTWCRTYPIKDPLMLNLFHFKVRQLPIRFDVARPPLNRWLWRYESLLVVPIVEVIE